MMAQVYPFLISVKTHLHGIISAIRDNYQTWDERVWIQI